MCCSRALVNGEFLPSPSSTPGFEGGTPASKYAYVKPLRYDAVGLADLLVVAEFRDTNKCDAGTELV